MSRGVDYSGSLSSSTVTDIFEEMIYELLNFPVYGDHDGCLVALEEGENFPFDIKRVYYVWGTRDDMVRGKHAHRRLEQVIVCVSGSCDFILDDGQDRAIIHLHTPTQGLYIKSNIWREFTHFSPDCVVVVLASECYDESDYIRSYEQFRSEVSQRSAEGNESGSSF